MDLNNFSIKPFKYGVKVYLNGCFWETADSYDEARKDIENYLLKEHIECTKI